MNISIIVAVAKNLAIGKKGDLPWRLPKDMKFFKEKTMGHFILTGRKNYYSIPEKFRPLQGRHNIIVSRNLQLLETGCYVVKNIDEGIQLAEKKGESEMFVIGGGEIYSQMLGKADTLYVTEVDCEIENADTFFPKNYADGFKEINREHFGADEKHKFAFDIVTYKK